MATKMTKGRNVTDMPATTGDHYLKAQEVASLLRIKLQTLYVYVSRGLVRRIRSDQHRGFLYLREDVEQLAKRGRSKVEGSDARSGAPFWSQPVVRTSITEIKPEGPCYRGTAAIDLANNGEKFENVAELIWTGVLSEDPLLWQVAQPGKLQVAVLSALRQETKQSKVDPIRQFSLLVASLAASATGSDDIRAGTTIPCARAVLRLLVNCLDHLRPSNKFIEADPVSSIAAQIAQTLGIDPAATEAIDLALVLLADHQLTPQTVAVRLTASSGASLYHCLNSALSVQSSSRSRRSCDRVEDLLLNSSDGEQFCRMLERQRGSAGNSAGLDHPLYPNGDPRAQLLLATAQRYLQRGNCSNRFADHITQLQSRTGMRPGVEIGLVMLCHALEMPERSAAALLTISRSAGWIGHVIEQRTAGLMLRPRIRYRG
jgi:citrate synthase